MSKEMIVPDFIDEIGGESFLDDLLNFPPDEEEGNDYPICDEDCDMLHPDWPNKTLSEELPECDSIVSSCKNSISDLSAELSVPYEDMIQLEWLSNFVEDSFSVGTTITTVPTTAMIEFHNKDSVQTSTFHSSSPISVLESSTSCAKGGKTLPRTRLSRTRTKRTRPASFNPRADFHYIIETSSKKKRKVWKDAGPEGIRKCTHCEITKTPQWRTGPMGPKTLCNACGVRHKSGRLFPEYRPAASPTFVPSFHSNSHKKVVEMRNKGSETTVAGNCE